MASLTDQQIEDLLRLESRFLPVGGPSGRVLQKKTYTMQVWRGLDYLVDLGYFTLDELIDLANGPGWQPANVPFDMRLTSIVSYWTRRCNDENGDFAAYCRGEL